MTKQLLRAVLLVGLVPAALAQGTPWNEGAIFFANNNQGRVLGLTYGVDGYVVPVPAPAYVQAFAAPAGTAFQPGEGEPISSWLGENPLFKPVGSPTQIVPGHPGRFAAGSITLKTEYPGGPAELCVIAWYGDSPTFDENYRWMGVSGLIHFDRTANKQPLPVPEIPVALTSAEGYQEAFSLPIVPLPPNVVPEPGGLALVLLSAATALCRRRNVTVSQRPSA